MPAKKKTSNDNQHEHYSYVAAMYAHLAAEPSMKADERAAFIAISEACKSPMLPPSTIRHAKKIALARALRDPAARQKRGSPMHTNNRFQTVLKNMRTELSNVARTGVDARAKDFSQLVAGICTLEPALVNFSRITAALVLACNQIGFVIPNSILQHSKQTIISEAAFLEESYGEIDNTDAQEMQALSDRELMEFVKLLSPSPKWWNDVTEHIGVEKIKDIRYHRDGGYVQTSFFIKWAARIYLIFALAVSTGTVVFNWGNREAALERIFDGLQVASFMLIGVFGLVKLGSDDPSVIRNTIQGMRVLKDVNDVLKYTECEDENVLKAVIMASHTFQHWLDPEGACYAVLGAGGSIKLSRGIQIKWLYAAGFWIDGNRVRSPHSYEGYLLHDNDDGSAHIRTSDVKLRYPNIHRRMEPSIIAG